MQTATQMAQPIRSMVGGPQPSLAPADALDILEQFGCTVNIRRMQDIYKHGEPTDFCWKILSGCARTLVSMEDGRRQINKFWWPGDVLGMDDVDVHLADAEAVTDVAIRRYPRHIVEAHAKTHTALALRLRRMTLANLHSAHRQIALLGRKTAVERIASFLLEMDHHSPRTGGNLVNLPMSRTDIADYLGLSIETVCRNLVSLQRDGTVAISRSGIELFDRTTLLDLAC